MDSLTRPHSFPGKLIIVEGIDGSGKSTQLQLAMRYLQARGLKPFFTEWNSADLVKAVTEDTSPVMGDEGVPAERRGEGYLRDAFGGIGPIKVMPPARPARRKAVFTTPPKSRSAS